MLYASNFHDGRVDVFDSHFHRVHLRGAFQDHRLPDGYVPFGIQQIHGRIYVSYAKQDADKHDDAKGPGRGFIDIYSPTGRLLHRLASRGRLNSPWGMALAPKGFGPFAGQLLVGNFGDGRINVFSPRSGRSEGPCGTSPASRSRSTGCGDSSSATAQLVARTPCCSAPGSMTRQTGSSARSTPHHEDAGRCGAPPCTGRTITTGSAAGPRWTPAAKTADRLRLGRAGSRVVVELVSRDESLCDQLVGHLQDVGPP